MLKKVDTRDALYKQDPMGEEGDPEGDGNMKR